MLSVRNASRSLKYFEEDFGQAIDSEAYTLPRTFQFAIGFRF